MTVYLNSEEIKLIKDSLLSTRAREYGIIRKCEDESGRGYPFYNRKNKYIQKYTSEDTINRIQNILNKLK